jgi:hypothetical protein
VCSLDCSGEEDQLIRVGIPSRFKDTLQQNKFDTKGLHIDLFEQQVVAKGYNKIMKNLHSQKCK